MTLTTLLAVLCTGAVIATVHQYRLNQRTLHRLESRLASTVSVIQKGQLELQETKNRNRLLEETVRSGSAAVEMVHRTITSTTFEVIDRLSTSEKFRANAQQVRRTHDNTSRTFYRSLRSTNKTLHVLADVILSNKTKKRRSQLLKKSDSNPS